MKRFARSPWVLHYDASSCNGCDIETLAAFMPHYDAERFGVQLTGDPKHADIFVITGSVNERNRDIIKTLYSQMPDPKVVVAAGICATSGGIFKDCYHVAGGVDQVLPVDVYITGCAVKPESILDGILEAAAMLEEKHKAFRKLMLKVEEKK